MSIGVKQEFLYQVKRGGAILMQTTQSTCRHDPAVEASILASGCEIFLNGKKLAKSTRRGLTTGKIVQKR